MAKIRVEINVDEFEKPLTYSYWLSHVTKKLMDAGIPIRNSVDIYDLESGSLERFDDPKDYGKTVYVWKDS